MRLAELVMGEAPYSAIRNLAPNRSPTGQHDRRGLLDLTRFSPRRLNIGGTSPSARSLCMAYSLEDATIQ
jgi:hypothetical protein